MSTDGLIERHARRMGLGGDRQAKDKQTMSQAQTAMLASLSSYVVCTRFIRTGMLCMCRCGPLIDLCRGPHVRHTGKIKAMQVTKVRISMLINKKLSSQRR